MLWWGWILLFATMYVPYAQGETEVRSWNDYDHFITEHISAKVQQHTPVNRMRRSFPSNQNTASFTQDTARYAYWFDFPEKMTFSIRTQYHNIILNVTRNDYVMQNRIVGNDYISRLGVYDNEKQGASVLIECLESTCILEGTVELDGVQYHIEQDESAENNEDHIIRKRALPNLEELMESLYVVPKEFDSQDTDEPNEIRDKRETNENSIGQHVRIRRSTIPTECDIIEVKALVDDTIWDYYVDRFGGNEQKAEDEIYKYLYSIYAEADYRLRCLTDYFTNYDGTCDVDCLRVILVGINITKTSSFTTGKFLSSGQVKGPDALSVCGNLNNAMANSANGWHTLHCWTSFMYIARLSSYHPTVFWIFDMTGENIAVQEGSTWYDKYRTLVKHDKICTSTIRDRVAIHEYRGDGMSIQVAHSLLRFIGARRDKDTSITDCSPKGWFLMRIPQSAKTENAGFWGQSWYLSDCTVEDICDHVNGLSTNCMRVRGNLVNETVWREWENTPLLGEIRSVDEQCKVRWGNNSVQCDPTGKGDYYPEGMCGNHVYCTSDSYTGCVCKVRVASGTKCGFARVCKKGECVFLEEIPIGEDCECHSQCVSNAICDPETDVCVCAEGYYNNSGNCTEQLPNGGECSEDIECKDPNARCINDSCQCIPCYYDNNGVCDKQSEIGEECNTTAQCKGDRTMCDTDRGKCVCETGYFIDDEANCVPVNGTICDRCVQEPDSCTQSGTACSDRGYCECSNDTVEYDGECYGTRIGESCTTEVDTCIDDYAECNGTICVCILNFNYNGTRCVGPRLCDPCDTSPSSCDSDYVCSTDTYRCECPSGQVQVGDNCYGRLVTEPCTGVIDTCIDDNAECNGTICDCMANYVWNGSICSGEDPCDTCDPALSTCADPLVCSSDTYRCECPSGYVQIGNICYGRLVGERCTDSLDTCIDDNAVCNGTVCTCIDNWVWNGTLCLGPDKCDRCDPATTSCDSSLVCNPNTYRCECPMDEVQYNDECYGTGIGDLCTTTLDTCIDDNAGCNGTICNCLPGYTYNGTACLGEGLCDRCDPSGSTCSSPLVCSSENYRCECPPGYVQIADSCYGRFVTEVCTSSLDTCVDDNAECNGTVCDCIAGFHWNGSSCGGENLCDQCDPSDSTCSGDLICSSNSYRCECPSGEVQIGDYCYGRLVGETCRSILDTCIDDNAACNGTVCDCLDPYVWNGTKCNGPNLCDSCDFTSSTCDSSLVCNPATSRCECPPGYVQISDMCYGRLVSESCTLPTDTCIDDNAVCNGTVCNCVEGFTFNGSVCLGPNLCDPCDPTANTCNSDLVCSSDTYRCECPPNQVQIGDFCYGRQVGEPCTSERDTCTNDNAICNGTICVCEDGFHWNGTDCVGEELCDNCDPSSSTCNSPLVCSDDTYRCECPPEFVQIANDCYGRHVGEPCLESLDTCIDDNAGCNGTVCTCDDDYVWNGTVCLGPDLCSTCDPSSNTCNSDLVCSSDTYRCECPTNRVQIGNSCYGRHVTEPCTDALDTCIDCNADCNGTICDCASGYTWNGTVCLGGHLCDLCDPTMSTCEDDLVCNPSTYRCECDTHFVQIGDSCYGTRMTEVCTDTLDTCTDDFADCNGTVCDCIEGYTYNGSICVGDSICAPCDSSTLSCGTGLECSDSTYRCECPPNEVQIGPYCYGTLVGEECTTNLNTCVDDNAICNGTICVCLPNWIWNGTHCGGPNLCDSCDPLTPSCDDNLVCSATTYRCECPSGTVQISDNCYGTHVDQSCLPSVNTCIDDNAFCNGTICVCDDDHVWNGTDCVGPDLCSKCDPSITSCDSHLVCNPVTYRCECPEGEVQYGDDCFGRHVGDSCTTILNTCIEDNAVCNGTICDCLPGYHYNGSICGGPDLCDPCDPTASTCENGLVCSDETYRCECQEGYVQYEDACYGRFVTEPCTTDLNTCINDNAICNGTVCTCRDDWIFNGTSCGGPNLCDPCDPSTPSCDSSFVCNPNLYRCECPSGRVQVGDMCVGTRVTDPCTSTIDTCTDDNAVCNGTVCDCVEGFTFNGTDCLGTALCERCDPDIVTCASHLVCSTDTYRCECPSNQVQLGDQCVGKRVGEECDTGTDTCIDDNAVCNGTICDCIDGFTLTGLICAGSNIGDPCSDDNACSGVLVCNVNTSKCSCPPNLVQIGDECYGRLISEVCTTSLPTCIDDYAECNGTVCDCLPGYHYNGTFCHGTGLCDTCDPSSSTCSSDLVCSSDTYRCECPTDEVQVGDNCYGRHVGDACIDTPDTCIDDNAACNGTICDCLSGFIWNGSRCLGFNLCDPCDTSLSTCDSSFVCNPSTYRCECPTDEVQISDACFGTHVGDQCTNNLDTCIDDFAGCNGTICDCMMGTTWNGFKCVGTGLCDPCDNSSSTCGTPLVCGSSSTCECPSNLVQIGDDCFGTRVTEACTSMLDTCVDCFAECNGTICDCITGYHWNGSSCHGENLCDSCDPLASTCSSDLTCSSTTYRCECPDHEVQISDMCFGTHVTELCIDTLDTCVDDNAECNGTVCVCMEGFTWDGSACYGMQLCEPCDPANSTCLSTLVCSATNNRCECPPGFVQYESECYGRIVGESCTKSLDTCIDDNAVCNGTICDCKEGYHYNGSLCVGTGLCDKCDDSVINCDDDLVCSTDTYTCECPSGKVQIGDDCHGTQVGEDCTDVLDTCTNDNAECNGTICVCIDGFTWNGTDCLGFKLCDQCDPTLSTCESNLECSALTYRCECPDGFVQISDMCYGKRVTEPCTNTIDTCTDDNARCNGTVCDCDEGFSWNGTTCNGPGLCDSCDPSASTCATPLVCSSTTYVCECPPNTVQIGDVCHGTRVTEKCTMSTDTCIDDNAACNGTICDCNAGYHWNGSSCGGEGLCDQCDPAASTCASGLVCSSDTYRCTCPPNQVQIGDDCFGTMVGDACTTPDTCIQDNAMCNGTVCDCLAGFTYNGSVCLGTDLCEPCDPSSSTCASPLVCSSESYTCVCPDDKVQYDAVCYGTLIGESCTNSFDVCIDDNAGCNGTVCDCLPGYVYNGSICVGTEPCDVCDSDVANCSSPLVCGSDSFRCECPPTLALVGDTCVGTQVGETCSSLLDTCSNNNAVCNGTVCDCVDGWVWNGTSCGGPGLCDQCDPDTASCGAGLTCSSMTYRCECPDNEVQISDECYGTRIGESCTKTVPTCIDDNAECNGTICDCMEGFTYNGSICVGDNPCDPCDPAISSCASPLVCSSDTYRCECPSGFVQIGDFCAGTRVTEDCTTTIDTCIDDNAICNGTVCTCIDGFIWNGSICGGPNLCDKCDPSTPSCASNLVCSSTTYRCECPEDEVQYADMCHGTHVGDSCTLGLDTCIEDNAVCNGTICVCLAGYHYNGSICSGPDLCDECDPDSNTCSGSLVCSIETYRCECPPGQVQYGDTCYGTDIGDLCTTLLSTCIDDNAICNGTVCTCDENHIWNGTRCLGFDLCSPCDPIFLSCQGGTMCNPATFRCECPFNRVQYGDDCFGTLVGQVCTTALDTCIEDNAFCNSGVCACIPPFTYNATIAVCVGPDLDDPCDAHSCGTGLSCGTTSQRCECSDPPVQIDNVCYGTRIGENCTSSTDTCIDDNAGCTGGVCACNTNFTWNGIICVGKELDEACDNSSDSCAANGLVCGPTFRCECPSTEVQINNMCFSLVCGSCVDDDDCVGDNVVCFDDPSLGMICKCDTDYYLDNCGICQLRIATNDSCDGDEQCQSGICICGICRDTDEGDCCDDCTEFLADLIFITDNSGSVGSNNYNRLKAFVVALANAFIIDTVETRAGVVDYSTNINEANTFNMNVYQSNLAFTTQVIDHSYVGDFTRTDLALDRARIFLGTNANRPDVKNIVVVITDGNTNDGGEGNVLITAANLLKNVANTEVYAVGIGGGVSLSELQLIASSNDTVFEATSFQTLDEITAQILEAICDDDH